MSESNENRINARVYFGEESDPIVYQYLNRFAPRRRAEAIRTIMSAALSGGQIPINIPTQEAPKIVPTAPEEAQQKSESIEEKKQVKKETKPLEQDRPSPEKEVSAKSKTGAKNMEETDSLASSESESQGFQSTEEADAFFAAADFGDMAK